MVIFIFFSFFRSKLSMTLTSSTWFSSSFMQNMEFRTFSRFIFQFYLECIRNIHRIYFFLIKIMLSFLSFEIIHIRLADFDLEPDINSIHLFHLCKISNFVYFQIPPVLLEGQHIRNIHRISSTKIIPEKRIDLGIMKIYHICLSYCQTWLTFDATKFIGTHIMSNMSFRPRQISLIIITLSDQFFSLFTSISARIILKKKKKKREKNNTPPTISQYLLSPTY